MDASFGDKVDVQGMIIETLEEKIVANSIETQLMLLESYDIHHGIFRHGEIANRPLALVELHEKERLQNVNPLYELFRSYNDLDVLKYTGIPFDRFIEMPRHITKQLMTECLSLKQKADKVNANLVNQLESLSDIGKK